MEPKDILVIVMWALPLVFGAGSLYFSIQTLQKRVEALEKRVDEHILRPGHDVTVEQLKNMKQNLDLVFTKVDEVSKTLMTVTNRLTEIAALAEAERKTSAKRA